MSEKFEISKKMLMINSISGILYKVVNLSVLVWLQAYLLKKISTDEYSIYPVVMSITIFIFMIRLVFSSGTSRFAVNAYARGEFERVTQITSTMFVVVFCVGMVILALGLLFAFNIEKLLSIQPEMVFQARLMMAMMVVSFVTQLIFSPFEAGLYIKQKFVFQNMVLVMEGFLRIALLFLFLFGISTRVIWVVVATEVSTLIGFTIRIAISRRLVPDLKFKVKQVNMNLSKELMSFGSWNLVGQIAYRIKMSADPIILNKFATPLDVTCFHLGSLFQKHIHQFIQIMTQPLVPVVTAMHATGDKVRLGNTFLRYGRYYTWTFLFFSVPLMIFRYEFIDLYVGEQFKLAGIVILLLLTESVLSLGAFMLYTIAVATGRMKELAIRNLIIQLSNLGLTLYLVWGLKMGAYGSALSTFITHMIGGPLFEIPLALNIAQIKFKRYFLETVIPGNIPAIITVGLLFGLRYIKSPASWLELIFFSAIGCFCYVLVLFFFLQTNDKRDVAKMLTKLKLKKLSRLLFGELS